ncbi:unnamed protein product [Moneuplotes crassus]|uniref:Isoprenoid biosynthesis protein ElbB n=1 Tax=Euplotes crassus TaxID=5936 RepID=A0AAD1XS52_EUPCR|nr:unnamed protein product [Moneuplotes crassus]
MKSLSLRNKRLFTSSTRGIRTAVVLSGCGVYDGSEITESVATIVALSKKGVDIDYYAPDMDQFHVLDHTTGEEINQKRNVLVESARITRGNINNLRELDAKNYDAIFFPGGFGAAKNLSTFGQEGAEMGVLPEVANVLREARSNQVNIGMACISPIIAAKVFGKESDGPGVNITLGSKGANFPYEGSIEVAEGFGNTLELRDVNEMTIDNGAKNSYLVTTPAYMKDAAPHEVFEGISNMVATVLELSENK